MIRRSVSLFVLCAAAMAQASAQDATAPAASAQAQMPATPATPAAPAEPALDPLVTTDTVIGKGKEATIGSKVVMHYTGWLYKPMAVKQHGRKFDSSFDRSEPFSFVLGAGQVIKGWDRGVLGMKVGGKRTLIIPSHLAYGSRSAGDVIKPGSDLIFDVELVDVQ
ncbi:MAG: FKBP-type peptidyl-prolyl cis-trans isomerase [Massilia sp.]